MSLSDLLAKKSYSFIYRAIARELTERLLDKKAKGTISLPVDDFAASWGVQSADIWCVVDDLADEKFWEVSSQGVDVTLKLARKGQKAGPRSSVGGRTMKATISQEVAQERANSLRLGSHEAKSSEVIATIPLDERKLFLASGYAGAFPASTFAFDGAVFKPDENLLNVLRCTYPGKNIESALSEMFSDLKLSKKRPQVAQFNYWMMYWMKRHEDRVGDLHEAQDLDALIAEKLSEF